MRAIENPTHDTKAFTVLEFILGVSLSILLIVIIAMVGTAARQGIGMISTQGEVQTRVATITRYLQKEAGLAIQAVADCCPANGASPVFQADQNSILILEVFSVDNEGKTITPYTKDFIIYEYLSDISTLRRLVNAGSGSARPFYVKNNPLSEPVRFRHKLAVLAIPWGDWLIPPAEASGDFYWPSPPPPPPWPCVEQEAWFGINLFQYQLDSDLPLDPEATVPALTLPGLQYLDVRVRGDLKSSSGHAYISRVQFKVVFKGTP